MQERHLTVARTARYHTLGPDDAEDVWIVCHGYGQLARFFLRAFIPIEDGSRLIVAPEALNRYYTEQSPGVHAADARVFATWMTREDRAAEIGDYVAYLDLLVQKITDSGRRRRITALGFSQGAHTVSRWAAQGAARFDRAVLWGAGPANDVALSPQLFHGAPVTLVAGDIDPALPPDRAEGVVTRMRDAGIDASLLAYAGTHRIEPAALSRLLAVLRKG